jgi:hypothetical protein
MDIYVYMVQPPNWPNIVGVIFKDIPVLISKTWYYVLCMFKLDLGLE